MHVSVIRSNYATKEDLANVRNDISKLEAAMLRWVVATILSVAGVGVGVGVVVTILKLAH